MKRVILCRPSGPRNVGMILRASANFGPCELVLVAPERPSLLIHPELEQMSHGVERARERCVVVDTLQEALADVTHSVGFTARARVKRRRLSWYDVHDELGERARDPSERLALVFGNEVTGLTSEESDQLQELIHIPTSDEHTSLNLAIAVGVVLAGLGQGPSEGLRTRGEKAISGEARTFLLESLKDVLVNKVALTEAARRDIGSMVERVFARAPLEDRDARAWHLVIRALGGGQLTPTDLGLTLHEKAGRRREAVERARQRDGGEGPEPLSGSSPE